MSSEISKNNNSPTNKPIDKKKNKSTSLNQLTKFELELLRSINKISSEIIILKKKYPIHTKILYSVYNSDEKIKMKKTELDIAEKEIEIKKIQSNLALVRNKIKNKTKINNINKNLKLINDEIIILNKQRTNHNIIIKKTKNKYYLYASKVNKFKIKSSKFKLREINAQRNKLINKKKKLNEIKNKIQYKKK